MYFTRAYPKINYDPTGSGYILAEDIITRIVMRSGVSNMYSAFQKHEVKDGQSPESIAHAIYGKATYHWVILMTNKMFDRFYDWPLSESELMSYVNETYDNPYAVHHYEISQKSGNNNIKVKVESSEPFAESVTNIEHERTLNDNKKSIKLLRAEFLDTFIDEYKVLQKQPF